MKKRVISIVSALIGMAAGMLIMGKVEGNKLIVSQKMSGKHLALFLMMNQWVKVKQEGKSVSSYFEERGFKRIAIYGMSYAGESLVNELKSTSIEVVYGIDKRADSLYTDINIITMDAPLQEVDVVVVTAITFFDDIEEKLREKLDCPIISLEDVLYMV